MKSQNSLAILTFLLMLVALYAIFIYAPTEQTMGPIGEVQRIFYFHVASNWTTFLATFFVFGYSILFLMKGTRELDIQAAAAAELGTLFGACGLISGTIWAKPIWGAWWTWDSRLTTTLVLWLLYAGYLVLRVMADDVAQVGRLAAVVGIVAAADVPVIIVSVRLWRTIHPAVIITRQGGHGLEDPRMIATLLVSMAAFTALSAWLLMLRFSTLRTTARITNLGRQLALAEAEIADRSVQIRRSS